MNKQTLLGIREYFDMVHDVTLRAIGTFTDEELNYRPSPETRTVRDLILHIYGTEKVLAEGRDVPAVDASWFGVPAFLERYTALHTGIGLVRLAPHHTNVQPAILRLGIGGVHGPVYDGGEGASHLGRLQLCRQRFMPGHIRQVLEDSAPVNDGSSHHGVGPIAAHQSFLDKGITLIPLFKFIQQ